MLWKKKKSYNLLKSDKKTSAAGSKYTKKQKRKFHPLRAAHRQNH